MKGARSVREEDLYQSSVLSRLCDLAEGRQVKDDGGPLALSMIDPLDQRWIKFPMNSRSA